MACGSGRCLVPRKETAADALRQELALAKAMNGELSQQLRDERVARTNAGVSMRLAEQRIAALEGEVAELKAKLKRPAKPKP